MAELKACIKSTREDILRLMHEVEGFCQEYKVAESDASDIRTLLHEATQNCVFHAYKGDNGGDIDVSCKIEGNLFQLDVKDYGVGIKDVKLARQPFYTTAPTTNAGMGFAVMESFSDKVDVVSGESGTSVTMVKEISFEQ